MKINKMKSDSAVLNSTPGIPIVTAQSKILLYDSLNAAPKPPVEKDNRTTRGRGRKFPRPSPAHDRSASKSLKYIPRPPRPLIRVCSTYKSDRFIRGGATKTSSTLFTAHTGTGRGSCRVGVDSS